MSIDVRPTEPHEYRRAADAMAIALMVPRLSDERWERSRPSWDESRSFSAWDGDDCVGNAGYFDVDTVVPGGKRLRSAAVARVGVLPTHRRLGIATRLMEATLRDAADRGAVMASLRASEATIYGRYGFGVAGEAADVTIEPRRARPIAGPEVGGTFELLAPDEIVSTIGPLHERIGLRRAGAITRPPSWIRRIVHEAITQETGTFVVLHRDDDGAPDGYAQYTVEWTDDGAQWRRGTGEVHDVVGADDAVELALWRFVLDVDLVDEWTAAERPVDDLLRDAVHDRRSYHVTRIEDEQWLRLLDVDAALRQRGYRAGHAVVISVDDPLIDANTGTWRVGADGVEPSSDSADLRLGVAALSALYLGRANWSSLVALGEIQVERPAAVDEAAALFAVDRAPSCATFF